MKLKSDDFNDIEKFVNMAKTRFGKDVKIIRFDNALEFEDRKCKFFYIEKWNSAPNILCGHATTKWQG